MVELIIYAILSIATFLFIFWVIASLITHVFVNRFFEPRVYEEAAKKTPIEIGCLLTFGNTIGLLIIFIAPLLMPVTSSSPRYESILFLVWWPIHLALFTTIWLLSRVNSISDSAYIRRKWMVRNYPLWSVLVVFMIEWIALKIAFKIS